MSDHLFALFARQARERPEAVAVLAEDDHYTYRDLATRAARVSNGLTRYHIAPEQPVGVLMPRSASLVAMLLGVVKSGAAYLPLEPADPMERTMRLVAEAGCRLVVGDPELLAAMRDSCAPKGVEARAVDLVDASSLLENQTESALDDCAPGGSRLAYLLFTSGSTGAPKAVEVEHRNVVSLLGSAQTLLQLTPEDRYLAASTICFDASITELFLPLVTGSSLLLRDRTILLDPRRLAADVTRFGVTVVQTGPSVWSLILSEVPHFPKVRVAITHGEAVAPELAGRLASYGDTVWNLYGPTETTVWATGHRLTPTLSTDSVASTTSAPIGVALPHLVTFVVDEGGTMVPPGTIGELCIGGAGVARGYRGHAELTQQRFVSLEPSGPRVYRTGDLVAVGESGVLHYFGRNDDQMQIRGIRIEPGEVEAALLRDARVRQAAVTWFEGASGSRSVVAAVVLTPGSQCSPTEISEALAHHLPPQWLPSRIVILPALPQTPSGKVDRRAIRRAAAATPTQSAPRETRPLTDTERAIGAIWQRLLRLPAIAPDDHFFSVGGDSLAAVQMMVEVEALVGAPLPVHLAFEAPTLERLSKRVDELSARPDDIGNTDFVFPLVEKEGERPLFFSNVSLTLARRGLWPLPCPLFAIVNWSRGTGFVEADSLETLARTYLVSVRRIQPEGPYRLAGYSLGGLIAFEMAQQLTRAGEHVELLFLLDPTQPYRVSGLSRNVPTMPDQDAFGRRVVRHAKRAVSAVRRSGVAAGWRALLPIGDIPVVQWTAYRLMHLYGRYPSPVSKLLLPRQRWPAFWYAARKLAGRYVARPYGGRARIVVIGDGPWTETWSALLGQAGTLHTIEASHHRNLFVEPAKSLWMAHLADALLTKTPEPNG